MRPHRLSLDYFLVSRILKDSTIEYIKSYNKYRTYIDEYTKYTVIYFEYMAYNHVIR